MVSFLHEYFLVSLHRPMTLETFRRGCGVILLNIRRVKWCLILRACKNINCYVEFFYPSNFALKKLMSLLKWSEKLWQYLLTITHTLKLEGTDIGNGNKDFKSNYLMYCEWDAYSTRYAAFLYPADSCIECRIVDATAFERKLLVSLIARYPFTYCETDTWPFSGM